MMLALANAEVFDGEAWRGRCTVLIDNKKVVDILNDGIMPPAKAEIEDLSGLLLVPGFVDVQVNGGGGAMFNADRSVSALGTMVAAHRRFGTTTLMPTLISDTDAVMKEATDAVRSALQKGVAGIRGMHFEGPCLNPERKGVHKKDYFRDLDPELEAIYSAEGLGRVMVTLAPERVPAAAISRLAGRGLLICAGHTAASYDEAVAGLGAGIRGFTHLFNAMTPMTSRAPGVVGCALEDEGSWCGLIVDGHHVHRATARNAVRAKVKGKIMLVTDAMGTVGAKDKSFDLFGTRIHARDGHCALEDGTLAGSDLDMMSAVRNTVRLLGLPLAEALRMASLYPAQFLRLDERIGRIAPGFCADFTAIDRDALAVRRTWIAGEGQNA